MLIPSSFIRDATALFVYLAFLGITFVVGIKWLGIHREDLWNQSAQCPTGKEQRKAYGLMAYQSLLCRRLPELMPPIVSAARSSVDLCQRIFADRRWNCSSITKAPELTPELTRGTKEQALVHAISSAAITWTVAKMCSSGEIHNCPCGYGSETTTTLVKRNSPLDPSIPENFLPDFGLIEPAAYKWKGCSDNVVYGRKVSREWADTAWRSKTAMSNKWLDFGGIKKRVAKEFDYTFPPSGKTKMNAIDDLVKDFKAGSTKSAARIQMALLNNELGRELVEQSLVRKCKCHGVSSACDVQTCWYSLPSLDEIVLKLKKKYDRAEHLGSLNKQQNPIRRWQPHQQLMEFGEEDRLPKMVYTTNSPSYCDEDPSMGSPGTRMRECNASIYEGPTSCESLCCGRGYNTQQVKVEEQCNCRFVYCCYVKCNKCVRFIDKHFCK